jgi:ribosomal protein S27E
MRLRCPECRKLRWYFDSPTEHVDICLEKGEMVLRSQLDGRKLRRSSDLKKKLIAELKNGIFGWTCRNCGESIWSGSKICDALKKKALKFLK